MEMNNEQGTINNGVGAQTVLYSLVPLAEFKIILGVDDRENTLFQYCLITATYTIEQYCKRRLVRRKNTDYLTFAGEYITLREYPVHKLLSIPCRYYRFGGETFFWP
jgi:hypothetical protein